MNDLSKKILDKIKKNHISIKSKYLFILKNIILWLIFIITIFIGALTFSIILFHLLNNEWDIIMKIPKKIEIISQLIPFIWIISIIFLVLISYYIFRHTKKGYKYKTLSILLSSIVLSLLFGTIFHTIKISHMMEQRIEKKLGKYQYILNREKDLWNKPEMGMIGGYVKIFEPNKFEITDFIGINWKIITNENTLFFTPEIKEGMKIKIIGEKIKKHEFLSKEIRPWIKQNKRKSPHKINEFIRPK